MRALLPEALLGTTASRALAIGEGVSNGAAGSSRFSPASDSDSDEEDEADEVGTGAMAGACPANGQGSGSRKRPREGGE